MGKKHEHKFEDLGLGYFVGETFFHDPQSQTSDIHHYKCGCGEQVFSSTPPSEEPTMGKKHRCLVYRRLTYNWYCQKHFMAKEAKYAIYDLEHLDDFPEKDREFWRNQAEQRLLQFAKYIIEEDQP